jgi:hypothetical protein
VPIPFRRSRLTVVVGTLRFEKGAFPMIVEDRRPEEPESARRIDVEDGVAIGQFRAVGQKKRFAPFIAAIGFAGGKDLHVVGGAFAGTNRRADRRWDTRQCRTNGCVWDVAERSDRI